MSSALRPCAKCIHDHRKGCAKPDYPRSSKMGRHTNCFEPIEEYEDEHANALKAEFDAMPLEMKLQTLADDFANSEDGICYCGLIPVICQEAAKEIKRLKQTTGATSRDTGKNKDVYHAALLS